MQTILFTQSETTMYRKWPEMDSSGLNCDHYVPDFAVEFHDRSPDRDLRGPHELRELQLMLRGAKPLAMVHFGEKEWSRNAAEHDWVMVPDTTSLSHSFEKEWLVAPRSEAYRITMLETIYRRIRARGRMTRSDHVKVGRLLGYTKEQIRFFISSLKKDASR